MKRHNILHIRIILFLTIINFCYSCKLKSPEQSDTTKIYWDTIKIAIDENYYGIYTMLSDVYKDKLYGYNHKLRTIDVFDLSNRKAIQNIPLEKEGPDGIPLVDGYSVCGNEIIINGRTQYIIIDTTGKVKKKIQKKDLNVENTYPGYTIENIKPLLINNFIKSYYNCNTQEIIAPVYPTDILNTETRYEGFCLLKINSNTNTTTLLPIPYPDIFKKGKYYGNLDDIQFCWRGDSIIYNFPNSSDVYIFNQANKEIKRIEASSKYTSNISETLAFNSDRQQIMSHYLHSLFFHKITYDKYRDLFYRIHVSKCETNRFLEDRDMYLSIFNHKLEKIDEIKLPTSIYPIYNITEEGIMFQFLKEEDSDYFSYVVLSFNAPYKRVENENFIHKAEKKDSILPRDSITIEKKVASKKEKSQIDLLKTTVSMDLIQKFVEENIVYPPSALKNNEEGIVQMLIRFDSTGVVSEYKMIYGCNNEALEKEAQRVTHLIKKVKTEKSGGYGFPVIFNIKKYKENRKE